MCGCPWTSKAYRPDGLADQPKGHPVSHLLPFGAVCETEMVASRPAHLPLADSRFTGESVGVDGFESVGEGGDGEPDGLSEGDAARGGGEEALEGGEDRAINGENVAPRKSREAKAAKASKVMAAEHCRLLPPPPPPRTAFCVSIAAGGEGGADGEISISAGEISISTGEISISAGEIGICTGEISTSKGFHCPT
jgi:hypothetical protein